MLKYYSVPVRDSREYEGRGKSYARYTRLQLGAGCSMSNCTPDRSLPINVGFTKSNYRSQFRNPSTLIVKIYSAKYNLMDKKDFILDSCRKKRRNTNGVAVFREKARFEERKVEEEKVFAR